MRTFVTEPLDGQASPSADGPSSSDVGGDGLRRADNQFRILHIGKFYPPARGGIETYLADLMQQQRSHGMDARALVHGQPLADDPSWIERLPVHIRLIFTPISLGFPWAIRRQLKSFQPDVLHLHMPNVAVFWLLSLRRARRIPWVIHWHSDVTFSAGQKALSLAYRLYQPFERSVLAQARYVIATSPPYLQASETLKDWHDKCVAIPLGLQLQDTSQAQCMCKGGRDQQDLCDESVITKAQWVEGKLRVLSIGRLTYYKGFEILVQAVSAMPNVQLQIVGDGDLRSELQELIAALRAQGLPADVQLLGGVSEDTKHSLLATCDVFALASRERTEAFGLALVEAMQFARPCVVTDLQGSGMPWLIRQSGAGLCVPMEDVSAWRRAFSTLASDPGLRQCFGNAGRLAAHELFSIGANSSHVKSLYASLVPEHQSTHRGTVMVMSLQKAISVSQLQTWHTWLKHSHDGDMVLIEEAQAFDGGEAGLADWLRANGVVVIHAPRDFSTLSATQTAMRWALRQGYKQLLFVPAQMALMPDVWSSLRASMGGLLEQAEANDVDIVQVVAVAPSTKLSKGWVERWLSFLMKTDVSLDSGQSLYVFKRAALEKSYQKRLSILDQPEIGLRLLAIQAQIKIEVIPLEIQLATPKKTRWRELGRSARLCVVGTLMYFAKRTSCNSNQH
ncbi:glycosyltransferase [Lampropedia puyangensis]|uniref:Glycosyltransferase n=1 Tax=Lampropedia puyangensis TaxID=1330072 RepID=A0A4S8FAX6_9BURK|nr:glycosyltransferase [Lampropedia puyangensis]THU02762.1 glycosyltransferase [Lampropedia puyangensis]